MASLLQPWHDSNSYQKSFISNSKPNFKILAGEVRISIVLMILCIIMQDDEMQDAYVINIYLKYCLLDFFLNKYFLNLNFLKNYV